MARKHCASVQSVCHSMKKWQRSANLCLRRWMQQTSARPPPPPRFTTSCKAKTVYSLPELSFPNIYDRVSLIAFRKVEGGLCALCLCPRAKEGRSPAPPWQDVTSVLAGPAVVELCKSAHAIEPIILTCREFLKRPT